MNKIQTDLDWLKFSLTKLAIPIIAGASAGYFLTKKNRAIYSIVFAFLASVIYVYFDIYKIGSNEPYKNDVNDENEENGNGTFEPNDEYSPIEENDGYTWNDGTNDGSGSVTEMTDVYNPNNGRDSVPTTIISPYNSGVIR